MIESACIFAWNLGNSRDYLAAGKTISCARRGSARQSGLYEKGGEFAIEGSEAKKGREVRTSRPVWRQVG